MIEYQQDEDGGVSCKHRLPDDLHPISWCSVSKELCLYDARCRVPILTPLAEVVNAAEELAEASARLVRLMEREGYGAFDLVAVRKALCTIEPILKNQAEA